MSGFVGCMLHLAQQSVYKSIVTASNHGKHMWSLATEPASVEVSAISDISSSVNESLANPSNRLRLLSSFRAANTRVVIWVRESAFRVQDVKRTSSEKFSPVFCNLQINCSL